MSVFASMMAIQFIYGTRLSRFHHVFSPALQNGDNLNTQQSRTNCQGIIPVVASNRTLSLENIQPESAKPVKKHNRMTKLLSQISKSDAGVFLSDSERQSLTDFQLSCAKNITANSNRNLDRHKKERIMILLTVAQDDNETAALWKRNYDRLI